MTTGYGVEVWCTDSLVTGRLVSGWRVVAQALYRRLITPRGTLRGGAEQAAYGVDLAEYIGRVAYPGVIATLPGLVRGEFLKDDRVADALVTVTSDTATNGAVAITIVAVVQLQDTDEQFALTITADSGGVQLALAEAA